MALIRNTSAMVLLAVVALSGCAGSPSLTIAELRSNPEYRQGPAEHIAVMMLYPDERFEDRALVENAFTAAWRANGIDAQPGYRFFDQYGNVDDRVDEMTAELTSRDIDTVVIIDPIRALAYDPAAYTARRSAYRALGLDTSASFNLIGQMAAEADAAKYVMEVSVWSPAEKEFGWAARYDINAPNGYDTDYAKTYSADFAQKVEADLKAAGLLR